MSDEAGLRVVLCWHMHQPQYCDLISGEYKLPWSYLHATKDYVDMAAHLEAVPDARAVVNFAPVLLEQIDDYAAQVRGYLHEHKALRDPLLAALVLSTILAIAAGALTFVAVARLTDAADVDHPAGLGPGVREGE